MSLKAFVFDIEHNRSFGIMFYVRIFKGELFKGQLVRICNSSLTFKVEFILIHTPKKKWKDRLFCGEIGCFISNLKKEDKNIRSGSTIVDASEKKDEPIIFKHLFKEKKSYLFCNIFPDVGVEFNFFSKNLKKLEIQNSGFTVESIESKLLGKGFRCGFNSSFQKLILLERLKEEFECDVISTPPSIIYQIVHLDRSEKKVYDPLDPSLCDKIKYIKEPFVNLSVFTPNEYLWEIVNLCELNRAKLKTHEEINDDFCHLTFFFPFSELIENFNDNLKSVSNGYAYSEYEFSEFVESDIVKVEILINGELISDLSFFTHRSSLNTKAKKICEGIKKVLTRENFSISIQARAEKKIFIRENIQPLKKNVTGNLYGGDRTRKMKLWQKQKRGKKKLLKLGKVTLKIDIFKKIFGR